MTRQVPLPQLSCFSQTIKAGLHWHWARESMKAQKDKEVQTSPKKQISVVTEPVIVRGGCRVVSFTPQLFAGKQLQLPPSFNVPIPCVLPKTHNQLQQQFFINTFTTSNTPQPIKLDPVLLSSNTKSKLKRQLNGYVFLRKAEMLWQILQHRNTRTRNTARISLRWTTPTTLHLLFQIHHGSQRRCLPNQTLLWFCNSYFMPQFCLILEYLQFWRVVIISYILWFHYFIKGNK